MLIIILVIIGLSLLILGHEAGHFFAAKAFGLQVDEFGFGFPPRLTSWKKGETEYSLNWLPFGGFVKIAGERGEFEMLEPSGAYEDAPDASRFLYAQPMWKKSIIVLAGVFVNFLLGWLFLSLTLMIGAPQALVVGGVQPDSPAAQAGIMAGDVVKNFTSAQSFIDFVNMHRGETTTIAVLRGNKEIDFSVVPRVQTAPGQGAVGVALAEAGTPREGFFSAFKDGLVDAGIIAWLTLQAFYQLFVQLLFHASLLPGVVGPVGIFGLAEETGKIGLVYLLQLFGVISLNLTVVNLIPFPALDGGRFLMAILEKIKGSAISYRTEAWVNSLGFALLIVLMILLTIRDVGGLI
ncbi:MAG: M50 family metallopeptidase [Minisyncoccia bacterium]|jgi:regulator of sigma E protease